jgi:16S rRNA (guanine527-N7)-methyltransferase
LELIQKYFTSFTAKQLEQFGALQPVYREWNEKINVISRKDIESLVERHILHSLSIAAIFSIEPGSRVMDLGTGGGFPGIPLAILFPETEFLLVDSIGKKLKVVEAVCHTLEIRNVKTFHARAEAIKREQFDLVVSRAVAALGVLWNWSKPLLKKTNQKNQQEGFSAPTGLVCLKGGDLQNEIKESNTKPRVWDIHQIFAEDFFKEKYVLQIT